MAIERILKISTLSLFCAWSPGTIKAQAENYPNGSTVANFIALGTDGTWHTLYDYTAAGKVVILDFFFYDCIPCQGYAPYFSELYETYGCNGGGLVCLSVDAGIDPDELAEQFSVDFGGDFSHPPTIGMFNGGIVTDAFGVVSFPTVCVIDADNTMLNNSLWPTSLGDLVAAIPENGTAVPMSCTVGIEAVQPPDRASISPTITSDVTTLIVDLQQAADLRTEITDLLGRTMVRRVLGTASSGRSLHTIDLGDLGQGAYVVRVLVNDACIATSRIIVSR